MKKPKTIVDFDPWLEPYSSVLHERQVYIESKTAVILGKKTLDEVTRGYEYFGLHKTKAAWIIREWAPHAEHIFLVGEANEWQDSATYALKKMSDGIWELTLPLPALAHGQRYKLHVIWSDGDGYRIPSYATYVVQNTNTKVFDAIVWAPKPFSWTDQNFKPSTDLPLIYEAHIGMSDEKPRVSLYAEFTKNVLPRIVKDGYNTVQLMAIQEHPYYGSFGYHVSNFFAASSRFGSPEELKKLIDTAHSLGLRVILDLIHSHAVKNEEEGLSRFDGTTTQYFHAGARGDHAAWDSRVFNYGNPAVQHFLLSNCRFWLEEYHFDGFRFDGVTSMLYTDHALEKTFGSYDDYMKDDVDLDALTYLSLANRVTHTINPNALTFAEDMSGYPGLAGPLEYGGLGFDYRLSMGVPDIWIKMIKEKRDEDWPLGSLFHELTTHRPEEKIVSYAESHDQALVGDQTLIFRLIGKDIYDHMLIGDDNLLVERGVALHKLIRLLTAATNGGAYLTFMGNEFGHPEWIDFPREGNDWSYLYARRQWSLADDPTLKYHFLGAFDQAMIYTVKSVLRTEFSHIFVNEIDHVLSFMRGDYLFVFNFAPAQSWVNYPIPAQPGSYTIQLSSDDAQFGGQSRIDTSLEYLTATQPDGERVKLYLPARTAVVLKHTR